MAKENPRDRAQLDPTPPDPQAKKAERAALGYLLYRHPDRLTIAALSDELNKAPADFDREDAVERAVRELVAAGLLECRGAYVLPTRAALYFERLETD